MGRYQPQEMVRFWWLPTVSNKAAPTTVEFSNGQELTCPDMSDAPDFEETGSTIDTPDLCKTFVAKIPGQVTVGETTMMW